MKLLTTSTRAAIIHFVKHIKPSFFVIICMLTTLGQVAADLYLPSLPAIGREFETSTHAVQFTISLYMFGFAISQLFYGPLSDGFGRKSPLIVGLILLTLGTIACLWASTIYTLNLGRLLQGVGAGSGISLSRSILRDACEGKELARLGSFLSVANVTVVASAPFIGGYIQQYFDWRVNFLVLFGYCILILTASVFFLKETNLHRHFDHIRPRRILSNSVMLFTHPTFLGYCSLSLLAYSGFLAWLTASPILLQAILGFTPIEYGWISLLFGGTYMLGSLKNAQMVMIWGVQKQIRLGISFIFFGGLLMLFLALIPIFNPYVIVIPMLFFSFGASLMIANCFAEALHPFPKIAGIASSIFGSLQVSGGAISSTIISYAPDHTQVPLAIIITFIGASSLVIHTILTRRNGLKSD